MTEIKPCIFDCYPIKGNTKIDYCISYLGRTFDYQVRCQVCGARGPAEDTPDAAISAWNQVAGMREALERVAGGVSAPHIVAEEVLKGGDTYE